MKPTDNLHQLVKSLTGSEKRYFKVFAKRHVVGSQNKYEQLFDVYDELPDNHYDDKELKEKLKKKGLGKNLADDKKNLQEMIMKAMLSFHAGNSIDTQLNNLLAEEDFYRQKRLNDLRRKAITKAKELAEKYEKYLVLVELANRETLMKMEIDPNELQDIAKQLGKDQQKWLDKLNTKNDLSALDNWVFIQYRINARKNTPDFWKMIEERLAHPVFQNYMPGNGFHIDRSYYSAWSFYYLLKGDYKNYNKYVGLIYELYEKYYPHQKTNTRILYNISMYNYLYSLQTIKDFKGMEKLLAHAETVAPLNEDEIGESFQNIAFYRQLYYMNTLQFEKAAAMVNDIEKGIKQHKRKINAARLLAIYSNIAISYMMLTDWDSALLYTDKILAEKAQVRLDIRAEAMLHQLIARYELKQYDLLTYQIRNTQRQLNGKGALTPQQNNIIKILGMLVKDEKKYIEKQKPHVAKALHDCAGYTTIQIWLYAKICRTTLVQAAQLVDH